MDRRDVLRGAGAGVIAGFVPWRANAQTAHKPIGYLRTNWSRDPYAFGSYSYIAKGARKRDHRRLARPIEDRIFFAGEAANSRRNSTVHAAYESGQRAAEEVLSTDAQTVGIIGAGMSGLSAAYKLSNAGRTVTVIEARDRIGGRIWTDSRLGPAFDLGASWIHGVVNNPLTDLSDELNLVRIPTDDTYIVRGRDGRIIPDRDAPDWLENVTEIQHSAGADQSEINARAYWNYSDYGGGDAKFHNGYSEIFEALNGTYEIQLNRVVKSISLQGSGVSVGSIDGIADVFDAVIVTLPLGVLKQGVVEFDPPLPAPKREAIERLGMGLLDKVYLQFEEVFWDPDTTWIATPENDLPQGQFNEWLNFAKYIDEPVIMAFNGGPPAFDLAELSDEDMVSLALQTLDLAYPQAS
ncbi:MAG: FAD-dependent oxidoreductase [Pseudomonadota bacterium]